MRNSTNIFLTNLSVADLLVLLVCTPTVLVEVNSRPETWVLGHDMCEYTNVCNMYRVTCVVYTLYGYAVFFSVDAAKRGALMELCGTLIIGWQT